MLTDKCRFHYTYYNQINSQIGFARAYYNVAMETQIGLIFLGWRNCEAEIACTDSTLFYVRWSADQENQMVCIWQINFYRSGDQRCNNDDC